jgi:hypothetical protein
MEIRNFIEYPKKAKVLGQGGNDVQFGTMAGNNPSYLQTVYVKAEELFSSIKNIGIKYVEWTALAKLDFRKYIEENFKGVEDWECNFSMIKQKRIELKRLDDKEKIDCFNISLMRFKGAVDDIFRELSDELVRTL